MCVHGIRVYEYVYGARGREKAEKRPIVCYFFVYRRHGRPAAREQRKTTSLTKSASERRRQPPRPFCFRRADRGLRETSSGFTKSGGSGGATVSTPNNVLSRGKRNPTDFQSIVRYAHATRLHVQCVPRRFDRTERPLLSRSTFSSIFVNTIYRKRFAVFLIDRVTLTVQTHAIQCKPKQKSFSGDFATILTKYQQRTLLRRRDIYPPRPFPHKPPDRCTH